MSVTGSLLLPTTSRSAPATTRSTSRSATSGAAYTRWTDRQFCPAAPNAPLTMALAALSTSASGRTMTAPLPPSSISVFLAPAARATASPVAYPPVKDTMSTSGWPTSAAPTVAPRPGSTASRPAGTPASQKELDEGERGQRRLLGGLEHDAVPANEGGGQLVRHQVEGVVVGRDRTDDADRLTRVPADSASSARGVAEGEGPTFEAMGLLGRQANGLDGSVRLAAGVADGLAAFAGDAGSRRARYAPPGEPRPGSALRGAARAAMRPLRGRTEPPPARPRRRLPRSSPRPCRPRFRSRGLARRAGQPAGATSRPRRLPRAESMPVPIARSCHQL